MATGRILDYLAARRRNRKRLREERVWQAAEVLSIVLLALIIVGGLLGPFIVFYVVSASGGFR